MANLEKTLADKLAEIACKQIKVAGDFKKPRMLEIRKNEEFNLGRKIKVPAGRSAIPLPTMAGFVETLKSKIDDPPVLKFTYTDLADYKIMQKTSAAWIKDSSPIRGNWPLIDRWVKNLAILSGRAIYEYMAESLPKYRSILEPVDHEDFLCEPMGGGDLERHLFCGKDNVFRTKDELDERAKLEIYDAEQVNLLVAAVANKELKQNEDYFTSKQERYKALGLSMESHQYVGQEIYKLVEWCMVYGGKRYYLLLDYKTGIWVRAQELKEVFRHGRYPFVSWATHEDAFNFWSKAPADDVRPVADAIDILFNQAVDNRNKQNFGMKAYDPAIFPNPEELEYRPDGLVLAKNKGQGIQAGIYEFKAGDVSGTIDLVGLMKNYIDTEVGFTPGEKGQAQTDQKVGIYFGNLQQMADKIGLKNKSYRGAWQQLGLRYFDGLVMHLSEPMMVKMIGEAGVEWDELKKAELEDVDDFDIEIESSSAEVAANEAKMQKRQGAIALLVKDPQLRASVGQQWLVQEILRFGAYEEAEVRVALSKDGTNLEMLSEASKAIQEILAGKTPKKNRGADTSFCQKILDFATDNDVDLEVYKKLIEFAKLHIPIAIENMVRKAKSIAAQAVDQIGQGSPTLSLGEGKVIPEPVPGTEGATISSSQKDSNMLSGKSPAVA